MALLRNMRSKSLQNINSKIGMIVQISSISTPAMESMVSEIKKNMSDVYISNYATRPACLFEGVTMNLTIILARIQRNANDINFFASHYNRWNNTNRSFLFQTIVLSPVDNDSFIFKFAIPKITRADENRLLKALINEDVTLNSLLAEKNEITKQKLYYRTAGGRYYKIFLDREIGSESKSNKDKYFKKQYNVYVIIAVLSSNLWWWYYTLHFDMYNCKDYMMYNFLFNYSNCNYLSELDDLGKKLCRDLLKNSKEKVNIYATTGERAQVIFTPKYSKPIIDEIDKVLAKHYGFTDEELDFIINYDIKYRMGGELEVEG
jgi:hypothetical protein